MENSFQNTTKELLLEEVALDNDSNKAIVLYNDDVNTFDYVIESLITICQHSPEQAEQASLIVHYRGKCAVKSGTENELIPKCTALLDRGLSAKIE
jgi:ATP-dependent Clp protease adaptor protein ClpS